MKRRNSGLISKGITVPAADRVYASRVLERKGRLSAVGVRFVFDSVKDLAPDGVKQVRVWHKVGILDMPCGPGILEVAKSRPWRWKVRVWVKAADEKGDEYIDQTEMETDQTMTILEMDAMLSRYADDLRQENPGFTSEGFEAIIIG